MELFFFLAVTVAILLWAGRRTLKLESRSAEQERRIAALTARVFVLESHGIPAPEPLPAPEPVPAPPPIVFVATVPAPPATKPKRDLETLIGGNWLSKLGVLMLLIGIALFLGFSLTEMAPMGRILTGAATALGLLGAGVAAERRPDYRVLGSALIGGGWAGLYFTAFAAHGLDASRVIDSAGAGFLLLLVVAFGMILHSLRYRNQTVTGLAFMAAFASIAVSSLTKFSGVASIPLLLSLLAVSWKFGWQRLAAAGAIFAYASYGFDLATGDKDRYFFALGEPVLWAYWLILEIFDLAAKRRGSRIPIAPFNLTGFLFATVASWPRESGWQPGLLLASMGVAQLVSAVLRGRVDDDGEMIDDSVFGGYRASITYSAFFSSAFVLDRFTGLPRGFALALLAESIAISGWLFRSAYLRGLGAVLFVLPVAFTVSDPMRPLYWALSAAFLINRLFLKGGPWYSAGAVYTLGAVLVDFEHRAFRPVLLTIAAGGTGLLLRWRGKPEGRWVGLALALLSVVVLVLEAPNQLLLVTICLPAALFAAFGWALPEGLSRLVTFLLLQCYLLTLGYRLTGEDPWFFATGAAIAMASWSMGIYTPAKSLATSAYLPEIIAIGYWAGWILDRGTGLPAQAMGAASLLAMYLLPQPESRGRTIHGVAAVVLLTTFLRDLVNGKRLTLAWGGEAFALLGLGIALGRRQLRISGLCVFGLALAKLFFFDFSQLDRLSRILSFIVLGCLLIAASWAYSRFREQIKPYL